MNTSGSIAPKKNPEPRVGPFVLLDELSGGAHARVFRARYRPQQGERTLSLADGDVVAIKVLRDSAVKDARVVQRFSREAELLGMLEHPALLRGITRGTTAGRVWNALEYVEGEDLHTLMELARAEKMRLAPALAVRIVADALEGLASAHGLVDPRGRPLGLIHRDLSPRNVLLDITGQAKIIDFGTALLSMQEEPTEGVVGTPGYLAPEQAKEEQLTQATDLYVVGLLAFELLTSKRAFLVKDLPDKSLLDAHAHNRRTRWPAGLSLPEGLAEVVDRALGDTAEDRPADAATFRQQLEPYLEDPRDSRHKLGLLARDLAWSNPERPAPLFIH